MLPVAILPGSNSNNPFDSVRVDGLLDTGATGLGIRNDIAHQLRLRPKGQRRVLTANGEMMAPEYVVRVGFITGDYTLPDFFPDQQQPFVIDREIVGFGLKDSFAYPVLVGMAILGWSDLTVGRDGIATLSFD